MRTKLENKKSILLRAAGLLLITSLFSLGAFSASEGGGTKTTEKEEKKEKVIAPFTAQSCNPLDGMGCKANQRCGKEASKATLGSSCTAHDDCGESGFCAKVSGGGTDGKFCIQRAVCEDVGAKVVFPAVYTPKIRHSIDLNKCIAKLSENGNDKVDFEQKEFSFGHAIDEFTSGLASAQKEMNDYFRINPIGKEFSTKYIIGKAKADEDYLREREEIEKKLNALVESNPDLVSSVPYYKVMAELYDLNAARYEILLTYIATAHESLQQWSEFVNEPHTGKLGQQGKPLPYFAYGQGYLYNPAKVTAADGVFRGGTDSVLTIPEYQLTPNICGATLSTNRYCVKSCESAKGGGMIVDPILVDQKIKRGFFGSIGCAISGFFGKKCPKTEEVVPDIFQDFGRATACVYEGPENKLPSLFMIREKMAYMVEFYSAAYQTNSELSQCMLALGERFSGGYEGYTGGFASGSSDDLAKPAVEPQEGGSAVSAGTSNLNLSSSSLLAGVLSNKLGSSKLDPSASSGSSDSTTGGGLLGRNSNNTSKALSSFIKTRNGLEKQQEAYMRDIKFNTAKQASVTQFTEMADRHKMISKGANGTDPGSMIRADGYTVKPYEEIKASLMDSASNLANVAGSNYIDSLRSRTEGGNVSQGANGQNAMGNARRGGRETKKVYREQGSYSINPADGTNAAVAGKGEKKEEKKAQAVIGKDEHEVEMLAKAAGPEGWDEYDTAKMLNDVANNRDRYSVRPDDTLFEIISKTYMRSALPTFFDKGDKSSRY